MPHIVQFTHPGLEHRPDKRNGDHKSWNRGCHKRKFMLADGMYVRGNEINEEKLLFWGEWEPPSKVEKLLKSESKFFPKWLHRPYLPNILPTSRGYQESYQNTDPCVFGDSFKYFVCKQFKAKNGQLTKLAKLEKGSLILFGSTANQNKKDAFFQFQKQQEFLL